MKYLLSIPVVCLMFAGMAPQAQADCTRTITLTNNSDGNVQKVKVSTRPRVGAFTVKKKWNGAPVVTRGQTMRIQATTKVKCDVAVKWKVEFACTSDGRHHNKNNTYCSKFSTVKDIQRSLPANACEIGWTNC